MSRTGPRLRSRLSVEEKVQVVLAVMAGEVSLADAARRRGVWAQEVGSGGTGSSRSARRVWKSRMPGSAKGAGSQTERGLRAEAERLKLALAEATVQLRIWRIGAELVDSVPSQTSKP